MSVFRSVIQRLAVKPSSAPGVASTLSVTLDTVGSPAATPSQALRPEIASLPPSRPREGVMGPMKLGFHGVWLRDHCPCSVCVDAKTHQRQVKTAGIPVDLTPLEANVTSSGELKVVWPGDPPHVSYYPADWLALHNYWPLPSEEAGSATEPHLEAVIGSRTLPDPAREKSQRVLFGSRTFLLNADDGPPEEHLEHFRRVDETRALGTVSEPVALPAVEHDEVLSDDAALYECLKMIRDYGFAMVENTPVDEDATEALVKRISFVRPTLYSPGMWMTEVREGGNDTAYTTNELAGHTDGCYWDDKPGIQVFHCLRADPVGGKTLLVDGFNIAARVKEISPEAFEFFSTVRLPFHFRDDHHDMRTWKRVFELDEDGDVKEFTYNNEDRSATLLAPDLVPQFYKHVGVLLEASRDPALALWLHLKPGTTIFIHNTRVLHGRSSFNAASNRKLLGCYLNNEEFESRLRVLARLIDN